MSIYAGSSAAATARWLLPATAPTCGTYGSIWANGGYLLPTRTAAAATSATGHCATSSSGDRGTTSTRSVIHSAHRSFVCHVLVLWRSFWIDRFHMCS